MATVKAFREVLIQMRKVKGYLLLIPPEVLTDEINLWRSGYGVALTFFVCLRRGPVVLCGEMRGTTLTGVRLIWVPWIEVINLHHLIIQGTHWNRVHHRLDGFHGASLLKALRSGIGKGCLV